MAEPCPTVSCFVCSSAHFKIKSTDELRTQLKKLDLLANTAVPLNSSTAPASGSTMATLESLLNTFVKQSYLEKAPNHLYTVLPGQENAAKQRKKTAAQQAELNNLNASLGTGAGGDPAMEWRWGPKSDREIGESHIQSFIYQWVSVSSWS